MRENRSRENRRRHLRVPLGLPVSVRIGTRTDSMIVELIDIAPAGVRVRALDEEVRLHERAKLTFVVPEHGACSAEGRVIRVHTGGEFIIALERANENFRRFLASLKTAP